ncbi:ammonium transporter [Neiella marina]|uniref:Ammonium transporter n=1 Tax=Neiella holothuriorum TaxID=2870530 RepID=A0ABS7EIW1_9GAMM|nr:ammonium transporter [Neiella holothuriorum]MBW8192155.1 ammonium transporter [Neiella holothuriorum]
MEYSWLLIASVLVFFMQAGFLCLETGKIRSKNSINVAAKNIADFIVAAIIFWLFGFALMFGQSNGGLVGFSGFAFGAEQSAQQVSFFIFQMMFCGTAATLMSGAVAERMSFLGYLAAAIILCAIIYPIPGHWAWASIYQNGNSGWLEALGFVDFAGASVVHAVGGCVALSAILIIGPRQGRFEQNSRIPQGSNLPMSVLGTLLIWLGWFGFNGGSTLVLNDQVPLILLNTCLAAVWSGVVAAICHYVWQRYVDVGAILNGVLAGLVGITAGCHAVAPSEAMIIGMVAGLVVFFGTRLIARLKIDDALGVVPVHLFAGIWGTLAVAIFGDLNSLATGLDRVAQLGVQLLGVMAICSYSVIVSYVALRLLNRWLPLRVSASDELQGMNISEHRASTELIDLLGSMHQQQRDGSFSEPVPVEPFTEVGQIARQYNDVIAKVNDEMGKRDDAIDRFRSSEMRKSAILDSSMDSIVTIDLLGRVLEFNPAAERTFGYLKRHVTGKDFIELFIISDQQAAVRESLQHKFSSSSGLLRNRRNAFTLMRSSGDQFPAEITVTVTNLSDRSNEFTLHVRDVTRQLKLQEKLKQLAYSDPLTGLYNRTYLMDSLIRALEQSVSFQEQVVLFFLDLDRFKTINDTLGHRAGDDLLCEVANRLTRVTRSKDIIARWGGDEFVVLVTGAFTSTAACDKAQAILDVMREPVQLEGRELKIPTSVGIAIGDSGLATAEQLMQFADLAMYSAKQRGRDNYQLFHPDMAKTAARNFDHEQEMRKAIASQEQFYMVYQPKVLNDGAIVGLEALMRWQHPKEGLISPAEFIPLAEESDLIIQLGELAIDDVLKQMHGWRKAGCELVPVSVNISGRHMVSGPLVEYVKDRLEHYQIAGDLLEVEITEGVLLTDVERCIDVMTALKALNLKLSVDDFGTGYSSLNYLKKLPLDILKIDRSFVDECATTVEDGQICTTIISLAQHLDLTTVAEGVESPEQLAFLQLKGCNIYQGYLFHKPTTPEHISTLLAQQVVA